MKEDRLERLVKEVKKGSLSAYQSLKRETTRSRDLRPLLSIVEEDAFPLLCCELMDNGWQVPLTKASPRIRVDSEATYHRYTYGNSVTHERLMHVVFDILYRYYFSHKTTEGDCTYNCHTLAFPLLSRLICEIQLKDPCMVLAFCGHASDLIHHIVSMVRNMRNHMRLHGGFHLESREREVVKLTADAASVFLNATLHQSANAYHKLWSV